MKNTLRTFSVVSLIIFGFNSYSQRYLSDLDSSLFIRDTMRPFLKRFGNLQVTGYMQPQFQVAQSKGVRSYEGGDFSAFSNNRFMLRRARVKFDYLLRSDDHFPNALFTFQIDATERGVNVRDMFVRLYETKGHNFSFTGGLFARPFGFEVNLSSAYRETPERGRMSQILMPTERDLGVMVSYEALDKSKKNKHIKFDAGLFNGQGLSGTTDFDSHKDFISRLTVKPVQINQLALSGGLSILYGGWRVQNPVIYRMGNDVAGKTFIADSSANNIGKIAPRRYQGSDVQLKINHAWGATELRAEYWLGEQPGTANSTTNPGTIPTTPVYRRKFGGAFFYFLQNIFNTKNQLLVKYDWYDPNRSVSEGEIGKAGTNLTTADIKYSTLGLGFLHYFNENIKIVLYYDLVRNEKTQLPGYTTDLKDDIFTCRLQYRF